jgi:Fic family protein
MIVLSKGTDIFQYVSERNRARQYDFLRTAYEVSKCVSEFAIDRQFLCDLNFYAVQYLSAQPGRYRQDYNVTVGRHVPPDWREVESQMAQFWGNLHRLWDRMTAIESAAFALWGVNHIHPFAEGNGRASRALTYFILCKKFGDWLPGSVTVTEQIRIQHRPRYCEILSRMDQARDQDGLTDLTEMVALLDELLLNQLQSAP